MISIDVDFDKLLEDLEKEFGEEGIIKHIDNALTEGAEFMLGKIRERLLMYKDTGATAEELQAGDPFTFRGQRTISLHWRGSEKRFEIVHLNERGYFLANGRFFKPPAYGQIEATVNRYNKDYQNVVRSAFLKSIGVK